MQPKSCFEMKQRTLKRAYGFEGKGLHTGTFSHMTLSPAPVDTGIVFVRTDMEDAQIPALAEFVTTTARSTTIASGEAQAVTVEHILSALLGLGVDNAKISLDNLEVPILDGSARPYIEAITADGLEEQDAERRYVEIPEAIEIKDEESGSWVRVEPADAPSFDVTADFGSRVLGVQTAHWDEDVDYPCEIGICRTFVFLHEIEFLLSHGLIKGGDIDNAIIVVEKPVEQEHLDEIASSLGYHGLFVTPEGYLSNLKLHFPNECGRHKLLDIMGDFCLCGGRLKAKVTAYKPGHKINTNAAKAVRKLLTTASEE